MSMTNEQIQALKAAAESATPGEWAIQFGDEIYASDGVNHDQIAMLFSDNSARDAEFIAAANPSVVLSLLAERDAGKALIAEQAKRIDELEAGHVDAAKQMSSWRRLAKQNINEHEKAVNALDVARQRIAELESHKSTLMKFISDSCYVFDGHDADISDAYVDAISSELMPKLESIVVRNQPLFWVRVKSDGGYEGPLHDSLLEDVRKKSGEWLPLSISNCVQKLEAQTVIVKLPESVIDAICLTAAEIHNLGRGVSDDRAQEIIDSIRCAAGITLKVGGEDGTN